MASYELVTAGREDIPACVEILDSGRAFQRAQGFVQWADGYPGRREVEADVENGKGYVLKVDGQIAAYMYLGFDGDPSYPAIRGAWHTKEPYTVIHRIAIGDAFRGMGLSDVAFRLVEEFSRAHGVRALRIDTHADNKRMQHVVEKNGFSYCGIVMQNGGERLAYDKSLG